MEMRPGEVIDYEKAFHEGAALVRERQRERELALAALPHSPASRFVVEDFDQIEVGRIFWRVKGLWPAVGVCFVGGPSMSGKSFWTLDALARVRRGLPVIGRRSVASGVVYVAAEGAAGVRKRIAGLRQETGLLGGGFDFIGQAPNLTDPDDVDALGQALHQAKAAQADLGITLGAVCIDTLSAAIPGADENNAKDMSPVLTALQALAAELEVLLLVVAHTGKEEARGLRGWSGLLANADGVVMLTAPKEDGRRSGTVEKVKDGEAGDAFGFVLRQIELGHDDDGDPITTCVVEHTEAPSGGTKSPFRKLNPDAELVLRALRRMVDEGRTEPVPFCPGLKPGSTGVRVDRLRAEAYALGLKKGEEPDAGAGELEQKRWFGTRRKAFQRGLSAITQAREARMEGDFVWLL